MILKRRTDILSVKGKFVFPLHIFLILFEILRLTKERLCVIDQLGEISPRNAYIFELNYARDDALSIKCNKC